MITSCCLHPITEPDLFSAAAREIITLHAAQLPNLTALIILLPNLHAAGALQKALRDAADLPVLLLPHITTLSSFADSVLLDNIVLSDSRRTAMLYQALRDRNWFEPAERWHVSADLLRLIDELTQYSVHLPDSYDEFMAQLEAAYQARAGTAMQFEARLAHELWYAMSRVDDNGMDGVTHYYLRLSQLAQRASVPLFAIGLNDLKPAEKDFFETYAAHQPVHLFNRSAGGSEHAHGSQIFFETAWPQACSALEQLPAADLRARALRIRKQFATSPLHDKVSLFGAQSLEQEAQAIDVKVRQLLLAGKASIAVVVQDRLVARRARALLERAQVLVEDETGWTFSTVAASAVIVRWLDAIAGNFYYQDMLDLLKSPFILSDWAPARRKQAVHTLERLVRKHSVVSHLEGYLKLARGEGDAQDTITLLLHLQRADAGFGRKARPLAAWLQSLLDCLAQLGVVQGLQADLAGEQLLQLLTRLQAETQADNGTFSLNEWRQWLNQQLETATFRDERIKSPVVFTHLAATRLRCFEAVILIGADAAHLPAPSRESVFFNQAVRMRLGLPTRAADLSLLQQDLTELLAGCDTVFVTWQAHKQAEHNLLSPYFERLETLHQIAYGENLRDDHWADLLPHAQINSGPAPDMQPLTNPRPAVAPQLIPASISASAYNSLMACPYQYYARHVLRLNELDEVQLELEKKDYGSDVHDILKRFHTRFPVLSGQDKAMLTQALAAITDQVFADALAANYLSRAWILRWQSLIPCYLDWQLLREQQGWRWQDGELAKQLEIPLANERMLLLKGRLDRVDSQQNAAAPYAVLDYKVQNKTTLKEKLKIPGEDVQLPVYTLLLGELVGEAGFVSMDKNAVETVDFPGDIMHISEQVRLRLRDLFLAMHQGAALPAQGIEAVCAYCEMRGLCRKDYWS